MYKKALLNLAILMILNGKIMGNCLFTKTVGKVHTVKLPNAKIAYCKFGKGKPLIMLMGATGVMTLWNPELLAALAKTNEVYILDNQGIGYSTDTSNAPLTIEGMAATTRDFINRLKLNKPAILGWSMGGEIALTMAVYYPNSIGPIISVAGDAGSVNTIQPSAQILESVYHPTSPYDIISLLFPADQTQAIKNFIKNYECIKQAPITAEAVSRQEQAETAFATGPGIWNQLSSITNPVFIINGQEDQGVDPQNAITLAERIPNAGLILIPDAAHGVLFQKPKTMASLIQSCLCLANYY